ncbi:glycoside hydrolase family 97 protein [uncultured Sphingomonas sp.]|uniref:glycoside hydrolase family 97 protein n=1 Tax=uncultured Sphingomonas sp. TaxID=158754 RepID=UPI0025EF6A2C|nr:glycoside hydrolase family 97 protein [uncultured Sphingomonas sp.]
MKSGLRNLSLLLIACSSARALAADPAITSPDGKVSIAASLNAQGALTYRVDYAGAAVIAPSPVGLRMTDPANPGDTYSGRLMTGMSILSSERRSGQDRYAPAHGTASQVADRYAELVVHAQETAGARRRLDLILRAYDQGAAFRMVVPQQPGVQQVNIIEEETSFAFPRDYTCLGLNIGRIENSHEGEFDWTAAHLIRNHNRYDLPLVCRTGPTGAAFALTESDLKNYSGAYLSGLENGTLGVAVRLTPRHDDSALSVSTPMGADGVRTPWRVVMLADRPETLIESRLVENLAAPSVIADTRWIKPGKASWDWWSGPLIPGVDNPPHDDATYKLFIDFAARFGLPYTLIDEGWAKGAGGGGTVRPGSDITQTAPGVDMPGLIAYAKKKGVDLWLWANWKEIDRQMDEALPLYEKWGIKGIKVDFMDRQDQQMVDFYHRLLGKAAQHHLMVNLHGAYVPRGLDRTFPNFMTQEGVLGAEYNKWTYRITASHNVHLAYSRALLGPMDYTPGGFRNVTPQAFSPHVVGPQVMTTRAHQLAMYVVYPSPVATLADAPTAYEGADGKPVPGTDFLKVVPTTWDETRALGGEFGKYIVVARRSGKRWFIGALNDEDARTVPVPLAALGSGSWKARRWTDGNGPADVSVGTSDVDGTLNLPLTASGGATLILERR